MYVIVFLSKSTGGCDFNSPSFCSHGYCGITKSRLDISSLQTAVQHYYSQGLAVSTHKCYQAGQLCYLSFCRQLSINPVPTTQRTLLLFTAYLAKEGLAYTFIKVYISAIRNMHITLGHHHSYSQQLTPYLEQALQGIKRDQLRSNP